MLFLILHSNNTLIINNYIIKEIAHYIYSIIWFVKLQNVTLSTSIVVLRKYYKHKPYTVNLQKLPTICPNKFPDDLQYFKNIKNM